MDWLFLATDNWYDIRDLGNISREILEGLDEFLPSGIVMIVSVLIGFVASFLLFVLPTQLYLGVYGERRIIGRMQSRLGPNRVGPFGLLQPIADAIKLMQKEALTPKVADRVVMWAAPLIFVAPAVLLFAVIPFGPNMVLSDVGVSLVYFTAISSIPVIAAFIAGWSSSNKYSTFGAIRIVAMAISYEVALVLSLLSVVVFTGTLNLNAIVDWQRDFGIPLALLMPMAFLIFFISASAELNRTPTDIAEAESEIVAGYLTEYSGMKWGLFYGMDIGYALAAAAFGSTLFLGGWWFFGLENIIPPWLLFIAKIYLFYFVFIWTRGTLPRLRIDQLMTFAWKVMVPLALVNLFLAATERIIWVEWFDLEVLRVTPAGQVAEVENQYFVYLFAIANFVISAVVIYFWTRAIGYRPEGVPDRARTVNDAGGYVPITGGGR